jgi:hypothetical protein
VKLWESLFGRAEAGERFNVPDAGIGYFMSTYGAPDNERILPGFQNSVDAYQNSGVVFGVLLARLMLFSEAEFKFQGLADKKLYGTAALAKLQQPWPGGTTGELLARMEQDASLAGNSFIRDAGTQLERLRPDWVTIVSELFRDPITDTEIRKVVGYWYDPPVTEGREPAFYPVGVVPWHVVADSGVAGDRRRSPDDRLQAGLSGERCVAEHAHQVRAEDRPGQDHSSDGSDQGEARRPA